MSLNTVVHVDSEAVTGVDDLIRLPNGERIALDVTIDVLRRGALRSFTLMPLERPAASVRSSRTHGQRTAANRVVVR